MEILLERIQAALGAMTNTRPRDLRRSLSKSIADEDDATSQEVDEMLNLLLSEDPNEEARQLFSQLLWAWDNTKDAIWGGETARNTLQRRQLIYVLLNVGEPLGNRISKLLPHYHVDEPLIISQKHQDWYKPLPGARDYYWKSYMRYLREHRKWSEDAILNLDNSTRAIVECLANPESRDAYPSRGLVMGYVQSGKTSNFAGVVARAADAGYRLIIVLAGIWNILRNQTQRRFDKELLGKEFLRNDSTYHPIPPKDWGDFLEHGADPTQFGNYGWQRLTRPDLDFKRLRAAIDNLEFEKREKALPIYDPANLRGFPVKLLVVKKNARILKYLASDLNMLRMQLSEIPALIIDDESDQAGLNTVNPKRESPDVQRRTATNDAIVQLLKLLPRGQYVGYTATPYANALVNPDDPEDLFPKDFIVSLERPIGYMGVSDFFDPSVDYADLRPNDFSQAELAFIRRVEVPPDADDEKLKDALRSYVLAGAIKIYRMNRDRSRYNPANFTHHTMLIHTSSRKGEHSSLQDRVEDLWIECGFNGPKGRLELEKLWFNDYLPVSQAQLVPELVPGAFDDLEGSLAEAIRVIETGNRKVLVLNSNSTDAPDFSESPCWKIIIGGNKLSRGYTVEGLTVSYFRRFTDAADTLMQMGRWFGFRPGYQDLVRVFLGVKEGKGYDKDLVVSFKSVCQMEERFRDELKRYVRSGDSGRITPKDIPPLISMTGQLPPTAKNKMFNAILISKNFGGQWSMPTLAPRDFDNIRTNIESLKSLLETSKKVGEADLGGADDNGKPIKAPSLLFTFGTRSLVYFLREYRWIETEYTHPSRPVAINLQAEFLEKQKHGIQEWLFVAPQRLSSFGNSLGLGSTATFAVKQRHRVEERGFGVYGEGAHRMIAEYLIDMIDKNKNGLGCPNRETKDFRNQSRGVMLFYPVRVAEKDEVSVGFELLFPTNNLPAEIHFSVRKKNEEEKVVVDQT
jgi:Z1 domain